MHYNTTNEKGSRLKDLNNKANSQEDLILRCFKNYKRPLTPWQIHKIFEQSSFHNAMEITSIRRALTNLTDGGRLRKTSRKRDSPKGGSEYFWVVA